MHYLLYYVRLFMLIQCQPANCCSSSSVIPKESCVYIQYMCLCVNVNDLDKFGLCSIVVNGRSVSRYQAMFMLSSHSLRVMFNFLGTSYLLTKPVWVGVLWRQNRIFNGLFVTGIVSFLKVFENTWSNSFLSSVQLLAEA